MSAWPLLVCQERKTPIWQLSLLAAGSAVLTHDAHTFLSLLDEAPLINGQHGVLLAQTGQNLAELRIAQSVRIPGRASKQVLEAIRRLKARHLG
jgi:hypothetical protein